jgi:hypothetical protein
VGLNPTITPVRLLTLRQRSIPSADSLNREPTFKSLLRGCSFIASLPTGSNFPKRPTLPLLDVSVSSRVELSSHERILILTSTLALIAFE